MSARAGDMNRRITVQQRTAGQGDFGQAPEVWADMFKCWAAINPLGGKELLLAKQVAAESTHEVTLRYRATVTPRVRFVYQGRVFNIINLNDLGERHEMLTALCNEGVSYG